MHVKWRWGRRLSSSTRAASVHVSSFPKNDGMADVADACVAFLYMAHR